MKCSPMPPPNPEKLRAWRQRSKPLAQRNQRRLAKLRKKQFGPQAALCRTLPCCACGAPPPSDPHHHVTRGSGRGLDKHTVPLCRECHDRLDSWGCGQKTFQREWGIDFAVIAAELQGRIIETTAREVEPS